MDSSPPSWFQLSLFPLYGTASPTGAAKDCNTLHLISSYRLLWYYSFSLYDFPRKQPSIHAHLHSDELLHCFSQIYWGKRQLMQRKTVCRQFFRNIKQECTISWGSYKVSAPKVTSFNLLIVLSWKLALVDFSEVIGKKFLFCHLTHCVLWPRYIFCLHVFIWIPWSLGAYVVLNNKLSDLPCPLDPWTKAPWEPA